LLFTDRNFFTTFDFPINTRTDEKYEKEFTHTIRADKITEIASELAEEKTFPIFWKMIDTFQKK
jgi:hypothetical protein